MAQETNKTVYQKARLYSDINVRKGPGWYDYENNDLEYENTDNYEIISKIGRGKYSQVFQGINTKTDARCVIKVLKPIRGSKVKREIKILRNLAAGTNIVRLQNVVQDSASKTTSLIFEYINNKDHKQLFPTLTETDLQFYMYEILKCLDYCHSNGIMHRDIKPQNIMFDADKKVLKVIDWGLAEFYFPSKEYNVRVASRYFKSPQLLVDYQYYDYTLDVWSLGAMFAGIIFMKDPFFMGANNQDQLDKIAKVLGTKQLLDYLKKYKIKLGTKFDNILEKHPIKPWQSFITQQNRHLATNEAIDLLSKMLVYDHASRILPRQAMKHPYFKSLQ